MRILILLVMGWAAVACGQVAPAGDGGVAPKVDGRVAGVDEGSKIEYVLLTMTGKASGPLAKVGAPAPRLTAQCTRDQAGKLRFELMADFGSETPLTFVAPWKAGPGSLFPPRAESQMVTMEFLGYVKEKPVKRQWVAVPELQGELKYNAPGIYSGNMESIAYYLKYLASLPGLRLTVREQPVVEFDTAKWQGRIRAEPLCRASGL